MDIVKCAVAGDTTVEKDGLKLFLEARANDMLFNTTIDFMEGQGFVLTGAQPQSNSCGSCKC